MLTRITHTKVHRGEITEVGAVENGVVLWRASVREVVQRYRSGVRYYAELPSHDAVEVIVEPDGLYAEPRLKTVADRIVERKLKALPTLTF